jgi:PAS domain S-box-containing protein
MRSGYPDEPGGADIEPSVREAGRSGGPARGGRFAPPREGVDLEQVVELIPDAVVVADGSGEIVHTNRRAEELFGYEPGELAGKPVELLIPTRLLTRHVARRERYLAEPRPRPLGDRMELRARHRDGGEFPAAIGVTPLDTPTGVLVAATVRDLTEESADGPAGAGELAAGIAHDFNNLLTVIAGNARFALERAAEPSSRELLEEIVRATEHGSELTAELLRFGRPGSEPGEPVDLNGVIAGVARLLRRAVGDRIALDLRPEPGLAPVCAARGQLEQILLNLAINARDAMPAGGRVTIATRTERGGARLTVADDGTGMAPEVADRAFEPFFTTKRRGEGTGLGLATVEGIVRRFGGRVALHTEPGEGTVVDVHVPWADRDAR